MQKFEIDVAPFLPFLPLIKGKVHSPAVVGGKLVDVHGLIDKVVSDGKITEADLPTLVAAFLFSPQAPAPAPVPQPPVIVIPPTPMPAPVPVPTPSPSMPWPPNQGQEAWAEEFWHDWFKGTRPDDPDSDWAPGGSPEHNKIITGQGVLPPGGVVRLMTGVLPQPSWLPNADRDDLEGGYVEHFLQVNDNRPVSFPSTADDGSKPRNIPGIAGIVMGPRYRQHLGWDFMVRFADPLKGKDEDPNPGTFRYWSVRHFGTTRPVTSNVVEFQVAHLGNL